MEREQLIRKWLDNELSQEELKAFQGLEDHQELLFLSERIAKFKPSNEFDTEEALRKLHTVIHKPVSKVRSLYIVTRVAAAILMLVGVYYTTTLFSGATEVTTQVAHKEEVVLPDNSTVRLNAVSSIQYDSKNWDAARNIALDGEAYFKVAKGSTFNVTTTTGTVSVLGTEFNVIQRGDFFEVICYEGSVKIHTSTKDVVLSPGERFRESATLSEMIANTTALQPSWTLNESSFISIPLKTVAQELERQYPIQVIIEGAVKNELFTGSFTHTDLDIALQSLGAPFNLSYTQKENTVTLARD